MGEPETRTLVPVGPQPGDDSTTTRATDPGRAQTFALPLPTIPRYTIVRQIGRGGMGIVYEAIGPLGVRVALKVILPERLSPSLLARFRQEARTMMDLAHPNLARFFDYDESKAGPFFTMRLLPGDTLADRLAALRLEPTTSVRLMVRVADAVAYLHARGLVHRDLKPSNILIDDRGEPHVSDFGLIKDLAAAESDGEGTPATPAGGASQTLTHAGARLGTEAYMSPEQFAGDHARIGPPTDVWALGVILHELAWGSRPRFDPDHQVQLPTDDGGSPVRTGLRPIVTRCLAWEPVDRYATAAALETELEALLAPPEERLSRRRFVAAGAAGVLALGAVGTWWAFGRREDPLDRVRKELDRAGSVELFGPDGRWRWSEWVTGPAEWETEDGGGWFAAAPETVRLLEISRGLPAFRLVVEVSHRGPAGDAGVYVGRSRQTTADGPEHCLMAVALADFGLLPGEGGRPRAARRVLARSCSADQDGPFNTARPDAERFVDRPADGWCLVTVTLDEVGLAVTAGDIDLGRWTRRQLLRSASGLGVGEPKFGAVTPTFHPAEGVGIFAYSGAVAVRSVPGTALAAIDVR